MDCALCKKPLPPHRMCHVCECSICARCEKCDVRLCRNCDNKSDFLRWVEVDGIDKYFCGKCVPKVVVSPTAQAQPLKEGVDYETLPNLVITEMN